MEQNFLLHPKPFSEPLQVSRKGEILQKKEQNAGGTGGTTGYVDNDVT